MPRRLAQQRTTLSDFERTSRAISAVAELHAISNPSSKDKLV